MINMDYLQLNENAYLLLQQILCHTCQLQVHRLCCMVDEIYTKRYTICFRYSWAVERWCLTDFNKLNQKLILTKGGYLMDKECPSVPMFVLNLTFLTSKRCLLKVLTVCYSYFIWNYLDMPETGSLTNK